MSTWTCFAPFKPRHNRLPLPYNIYFALRLFASLTGDQKVNSSFSQKVFAYFLENVSWIYQVCQFAYFTRYRITIPREFVNPSVANAPS
jgi:hypothetical protein